VKGRGNKPKQTAQLLHTSINGHGQVRHKAVAAGPSQHAGRFPITKEILPNESYTNLSQSSRNKSSARNTSRSSCLVFKLMQELHCRQAQASVRLHGAGGKPIAIRLHSSRCAPLLLVLGWRRCSRCCRRQRKGVDGEGVLHGDLRDGHALGAVPEPVVRPGGVMEGWLDGRRNALCTAQRKIPFRMSWHNLTCAARARQRMPWLVSERRRAALQPHSTVGAFRGSVERPRQWRRPVWTSLILSSSTYKSGSVWSRVEAGWHEQLRSRAAN
jgi:hypothetical protein